MSWLKKHAINVRAVDPLDEDFSDLEPLKESLKGTRVVMLGEMGHGGGVTFLAKSRLVKFLHREMGFGVLAWEAGFYDVSKVSQRIRTGEDVVTAGRRGIFRVWSLAEEVQELLRYVEKTSRTKRPLEMTGFDPQLTGTASVDFLPSDLAGFLRAIGLPDGQLGEGAPFRVTLVGMSSPSKYQVPSAAFVSQLSTLRQQIAGRYSEGGLSTRVAEDARYWIQMLKGVETMARQMIRLESKEATRPFPERETRDVQMGEHLLWLLRERFAQRKVIVWAASAHTRYGDAASWGGNKIITMGEIVREALGPEVYHITVKPYEGVQGNPNWVAGSWPVDEYRGELEEMLHAAGFQQAIVDVRHPGAGGEWTRKPVVLSRQKGREWLGLLAADQDAFFFIHTERPVTSALK